MNFIDYIYSVCERDINDFGVLKFFLNRVYCFIILNELFGKFI